MAPNNPRVDLAWLTTLAKQPVWPLGEVYLVEPAPESVSQFVTDRLPSSPAQFWLFWDSALGEPEPERILAALRRPGDVWHAGLRLGMGGLPRTLDYVAPTWMLNCDPDSLLEATSWRLTLGCCLVKASVLRQIGSVRAEFQTLAGAALELGHRYIRRGVLVRHLPWLLPPDISRPPAQIPFEDELRFIYYRFGKFWSRYALLRALLTRSVPPSPAWHAWRAVTRFPLPPSPPPFHPDFLSTHLQPAKAEVSILIPTLERYPYLRTLLAQLRVQTIPPREIIIVDQTPLGKRDLKISGDFADLPLKMIYLDQTGQCLSRNAGLNSVTGDYVLFLDDDDEVNTDLIARHLGNLEFFHSEVSSGTAHVAIEGALPEDFTFIRASDVLPTNNTLVDFEVLKKSGLFDLAYNKLPRADGDLGMRVYLSGALMVLNPHIGVLHHHAPAGGLRKHKARVITYASSRQKLIQRHLPSRSEIYLEKRYFAPHQVTESLWLRALGTFSLNGPWWRRGLKILISGFLFPDTVRQIRRRQQEAEAMFTRYPEIPTLTK